MNNATIAGLGSTVPQQSELMKFDPAFGTPKPYPSHAKQYREFHGGMAWLFNPWTGANRHPSDIGSDPFGRAIVAQTDLRNHPLANPRSDSRTAHLLGTWNNEDWK